MIDNKFIESEWITNPDCIRELGPIGSEEQLLFIKIHGARILIESMNNKSKMSGIIIEACCRNSNKINKIFEWEGDIENLTTSQQLSILEKLPKEIIEKNLNSKLLKSIVSSEESYHMLATKIGYKAIHLIPEQYSQQARALAELRTGNI